ncbi:hypothetical protein BD414DRAFT_76792 [Trametes punicea]|nr:hypothetical protein BD414DRAFT_76792 [Trametes punicea]
MRSSMSPTSAHDCCRALLCSQVVPRFSQAAPHAGCVTCGWSAGACDNNADQSGKAHEHKTGTFSGTMASERCQHLPTRLGLRRRHPYWYKGSAATKAFRSYYQPSISEMPVVRRLYPQLWARTSQASEDGELPPHSDSEDDSSELSELGGSATPSEDESTPDTEGYDSEETKCDNDEYYKLQVVQKRDTVWVKPRGTSTWYHGVVTKVSQPTEPQQLKRGPIYLVVFRRYHTNLRAWFSPLEGNIKPDTPRVRAWIQKST